MRPSYSMVFFSLFSLALIPMPIAGQTAAELESLLASPSLTYGEAARFILEAADLAALPDPDMAFRYAADRGWLPKKARADHPARLDGVSLLFMGAFKLKGGLFYTLTKSAHYAYRDLVYQKVIQDRADPAMPVSGEFLLFMTGRIMSIIENLDITVMEG